MQTFINKLKKGDKFFFNEEYTVIQKYSDWKRDGSPFLRAKKSNGQIDDFYFDELEVEKI